MDPKLIAAILGILLAISELLDAFPQIKGSSIWKVIRNIIYSMAGKTPPE